VLFRFGLSSVGTMAVKVALTWLFAHRLEEHVAYFVTHVLIFFWSYYSHLRFTFNEPHTGRRMWEYFKAVLLLKIADFVLFSLILKVSENELSLSVLIASLVMTSGRFVTVKRALVRRDTAVAATEPPGADRAQ
jgi:putative flippase GtrA